MPLFICSQCGCVDNTALGDYWLRAVRDGGKPLCSECAPANFPDGTSTDWGKWHDKFPKRKHNPLTQPLEDDGYTLRRL